MLIHDIGCCIRVYRELVKISKKLHKIDEYNCNFEQDKKRDLREKKLEERAKSLAKELGLKIYRQSGPRGCNLYLIDESMDKTNYNKGVAIY